MHRRGPVDASEKHGQNEPFPSANNGIKEQAGESWKSFVARQPILDRHKNIYGYELLFRSSLENIFRCELPDQASSNVLVSSLFLFGLTSIAGERRAFINFTRNLLTSGYATFLPPEQSVIEILENVIPDENIIETCRELKKKGYSLALDDYPLDGRMDALIPFADIVKIDWGATPPELCRKLADKLVPTGVKLLAEKVETHEQYRQALDMGYCYFQGFFFCEPEVVSGNDIPVLQSNCMMLLREANGDEPDLIKLERVLMREPSLCYKLLRYLNSAIFYFAGDITSVRHALSLLGLESIRKWISLVTLAGMGENKPEALVLMSVVRGRFCESIAKANGQQRNSTELFLVGIFSLIDAILDRPMNKLLSALPISEEVKATLLGKESPYGSTFALVRAYERSDWDDVTRIADILRIGEGTIAKAYIEAVTWAHELVRSGKTR
ncbi:MAG TPA: HDOD domain-containing protein [Acidobacteriota bacterium]|nr:HDOD domain-containing protein [Acidobacteriota bacterium]